MTLRIKLRVGVNNMEKKEEPKNNNWLIHLELFIMFATLIGSIITMNSRIDDVNARFDITIAAMNSRFDQFMIISNEEAKDFHGRLCAIEERNRK